MLQTQAVMEHLALRMQTQKNTPPPPSNNFDMLLLVIDQADMLACISLKISDMFSK